MLTEEEMALLRSTKSEAEWNAACDKIKAVRGGGYPQDWYPKVILSGFMTRHLATFGASAGMKIEMI